MAVVLLYLKIKQIYWSETKQRVCIGKDIEGERQRERNKWIKRKRDVSEYDMQTGGQNIMKVDNVIAKKEGNKNLESVLSEWKGIVLC